LFVCLFKFLNVLFNLLTGVQGSKYKKLFENSESMYLEEDQYSRESSSSEESEKES
jgi:hypothetical protein